MDEVTANVDILPTLIDMCRLEKPEDNGFDGRSLVPLLQPEEGKRRVWPDRALVTDSQRLAYPVKWRKSAVMTDRWRLVNGRELFAIKEDPEQRKDIAAATPTFWLRCVSPTRRGGRKSRGNLTKIYRLRLGGRARPACG